MARLAVMAHFDPRGLVAPHVARQVESLADAFDDVVVVSTSELGPAARGTLSAHARLVCRPNHGYDFFSYKVGLEVQSLARYDEVVLCNDTYVLVQSWHDLLGRAASLTSDFWGVTLSQRIDPHLQSFVLGFRPWLVNSGAFIRFWETLTPLSERQDIIRQYEVGLTRSLVAAGFAAAPIFAESAADRRIARRRVHWWALHRRGLPSRPAQALPLLRQRLRAPWNPTAALADAALADGRLPLVKIDTLRHDPYALDAERLLRLCEERYPEAFEGVRGYLADTAALYPPRAREQLRPTPTILKPLGRMVEYGRA